MLSLVKMNWKCMDSIKVEINIIIYIGLRYSFFQRTQNE